jgi:hypothetical protein
MTTFRDWTMADVERHNAMVRPENPIPIRPDAVGAGCEGTLHDAIVDECKRRGWIALHGSMARRTARTEGEWDFVVLADGGRVFFVECKTRIGKLSQVQAALHHWAAKLGHKSYVVRCVAQFLEVVK